MSEEKENVKVYVKEGEGTKERRNIFPNSTFANLPTTRITEVALAADNKSSLNAYVPLPETWDAIRHSVKSTGRHRSGSDSTGMNGCYSGERSFLLASLLLLTRTAQPRESAFLNAVFLEAVGHAVVYCK